MKFAFFALAIFLAPAGISVARAQAMGKAVVDASAGSDDATSQTIAPLTAAPPQAPQQSPAPTASPVIAAVPVPPPSTIPPSPVAGPSAATYQSETISPDTLRGPVDPRGLSMPALPPVLTLNPPLIPTAAAPANAPAKPAVTIVPVQLNTTPMAAPATTAAPVAPKAQTPDGSIEQQPIRPHTTDAATPAPALAAGTPENKSGFSWPSGVSSSVQAAAALAVVIGLIFIGRGLARKFIPGARAASGKGVVEILARHPLCKNQSLVLVRIGSQIVALNQCKESSESVLVISDSAEVARIIGQIEGRSPTSIQSGFNNLLANARMDLEQNDEEAEPELRGMNPEKLDEQLDEMAAAKRQLMELRQHVRSVRDKLPRT